MLIHRFLMCLFAVLFIKTASCALQVVDTGDGINRIVSITQPGLFRVAFVAAWNFGLSQWYDLANDPNATLNLCLQNPPHTAGFDQGALFNWAVYTPSADDDWISFTEAARNYHPAAFRQLSILQKDSDRVVIETKSHPMWTKVNTILIHTARYYLYRDGKIYISSAMTAQGGEQPIGTWRNAVIGLGDPTTLNAVVPDSLGWIRCAGIQNPYNWSDTFLPYIYMFWGPATPAPFTDYTKASILLVPRPGNPSQGVQARHSWDGFRRWTYSVDLSKTITPQDTIIQEYLLQLGTQSSSVLPDINNCIVAGTLAEAYQANPIPPGGFIVSVMPVNCKKQTLNVSLQASSGPESGARIVFTVPERPRLVHLALYDMSGRLKKVLINGVLKPGKHAITWENNGNARSMYVCVLKMDGHLSAALKIVL